MPNDPVCIRRTNTLEEAAIIVGWLEDRGVEAKVVDPANPGVMAFGVTDPEGIEIYVADAPTAKQATTLLAEHDREQAKSTGSGTIEVTCEACDMRHSFPVSQRGTVQECSGCGAYIDLPE